MFFRRALTHQDILSDRQARVLDVRNPSPERVIMTLDILKLKKACLIPLSI